MSYWTTITGGKRITAQQAVGLMSSNQDAFRQTLCIIRGMCDDKIAENAKNGKPSVTFDVPPSVFGRELYDHKTMGRALANDLHQDGYIIRGKSTSLIVSWVDPNDSLPVGVQSSPSITSTTTMKRSAPTKKRQTTRKGGKVELKLNV